MDHSNLETTEGAKSTTYSSKNNSTDSENFWVNETVSLLALSLLHGVGYWTLRNLALAGLGFKQVLKADSSAKFINYLEQVECKTARQIGENWPNTRSELWNHAVKLYHELKAQGIQVIHSAQEGFPVSLREISDPPKWLFVQGELSILHRPSLAIVGTRKPSEDGIFLANYIGASLSYFDAVTVSGLALGIDQIIHKKSIRVKTPTIAFLGTGILCNYPAGSEKLRQQICEHGGAIVSEYLPSQSYSSENFVHRNRLQAGLANVVIPVEWKEKGGTAHTVKFAHKAQKQIVCLKLPDWSDTHSELLLAEKLDAKIFTIPGEEEKFRAIVNKILNKPTLHSSEDKSSQKIDNFSKKPVIEKTYRYQQLSLFD